MGDARAAANSGGRGTNGVANCWQGCDPRLLALCTVAFVSGCVTDRGATATVGPATVDTIAACTKAIVQIQPVAGPPHASLPWWGSNSDSDGNWLRGADPPALYSVDYRVRRLAAAELRLPATPPAKASPGKWPEYGQLVAERLRAARLTGVVGVAPLKALPDTYVLSLGKSRATPSVLEGLRQGLTHGGFRYKYVEASRPLRAATGGDVMDPDYGVDGAGQWGLQSVRANVAWPRIRVSQGRNKTIVAVIDSGIYAQHPDLIHELWHPDPARQAGLPANVDDQPFGATFIDGVPENTPPEDEWSHGSHVAGIVAAESDNPYAVKSVMLRGTAQLLTAKIFAGDNTGSDNTDTTDTSAPQGTAPVAPAVPTGCTDNLISAIDYVIDPYDAVDPPDANFEPFTTQPANPDEMARIRSKADTAGGAWTINLSSYQMQYSQALDYYLRWVATYFQKVLLVVAAPDNIGISRLGPGANASYPSSLGLANVLVVTGSNQDRCLVYPYGRSVVDIAAPSKDILSTVLPAFADGTKRSGGTSAATPFVSGAAALVQYLAPDSWGYREVKETILRSAQDMCVVGTAADKSKYESTCPYHDDLDVRNTIDESPPYPSLCGAARSNGLLDVDAATAPPIVGQITGLDGTQSNGIMIAPVSADNSYASGSSVTVSWRRRVPASANYSQADLPLCPTVDIDVIGGDSTDDLAAPSRAPLASAPSVNIELQSSNIRLPDVAADLAVQIRIQCSNSHLFRLSDSFTVKAP